VKVIAAEKVKEPRARLEGEIYRRTLLAFAGLADRLQLVLRPDLGLGPDGADILQRLRGNLLRTTKASEWPGTILLEDEAEIFEYKYDPEVAVVLGEAASSFQEWVQPHLPEDPSLWISDRPALFCVSHEGYVGLDLRQEERQRLRAQLGFEL
jgi:hypothetical protein